MAGWTKQVMPRLIIIDFHVFAVCKSTAAQNSNGYKHKVYPISKVNKTEKKLTSYSLVVLEWGMEFPFRSSGRESDFREEWSFLKI